MYTLNWCTQCLEQMMAHMSRPLLASLHFHLESDLHKVSRKLLVWRWVFAFHRLIYSFINFLYLCVPELKVRTSVFPTLSSETHLQNSFFWFCYSRMMPAVLWNRFHFIGVMSGGLNLWLKAPLSHDHEIVWSIPKSETLVQCSKRASVIPTE